MGSSTVYGVLAALGCPFVMTIGFIVWDKVWTGHPTVLNAVKCTIGTFFFVVTFPFIDGVRWVPEVPAKTTAMLLISSFIGIIVGDTLWLQALKQIGSRRVIMIDVIKPFCAAAFGWLVFGEKVYPLTILGIAMAMAGVLIVSLEKEAPPSDSKAKRESNHPASLPSEGEEKAPAVSIHRPSLQAPPDSSGLVCAQAEPLSRVEPPGDQEAGAAPLAAAAPPGGGGARRGPGYACAAANVVLDVYGSVLTKQHAAALSTWGINAVRFGAPAWAQLPRLARRGWAQVVAGVALVTYLAPAMSQYALFRVDLAAALTLGSLGPLFALPLGWALKGERATARALAGAALGAAGVVPLYFGGRG